MSWSPRRRFWTSVAIRTGAGGFGVDLDGRALRTPARAPLVVPTRGLAEAIAAEWDALEAAVEPERLPFTRLANSAIDRVAAQRTDVAAAVAAYGETDLICYRAEEPEELRSRQAVGWDPWLDWADRELGAPLVAVTGLMHRAQPPASRERLRAAVATHEPFALTALHELATLSGSLVLGLAVSRGALAGAEAWELSRIDEDWQIEQWGRDPEAEAAAAQAQADFLRAERLLMLARAPADRMEPARRPDSQA